MNYTLSLKYNEIAWHEVFMQYENSASLISISDRLKCKYFQCNKSSLKQTIAQGKMPFGCASLSLLEEKKKEKKKK